MLAVVPMFVAGAADTLADLALNCLAVAGGFLAGTVLGGLIGWALDKWVFTKKSPEIVKKLVRVVCGILVALIVAAILFNKGTGGGGGGGTGKGTGPDQSGDTPGKVTDKQPDEKRPVKAETPKISEIDTSTPQVRVTFLGGDAAQPAAGRFYYLADEPVLKTFDEVKTAVEAKKREAAGKQVLLVVVYPTDRTRAADEHSRTVTQVTDWARGAGLRVVLGSGTP